MPDRLAGLRYAGSLPECQAPLLTKAQLATAAGKIDASRTIELRDILADPNRAAPE